MCLMRTVFELIRETLRLPERVEISSSSGPGTLEGWDSLGHAAIITAVESSYGLSLTMEQILSIESVADIERVVHGAP